MNYSYDTYSRDRLCEKLLHFPTLKRIASFIK